MSGSDDAWDRFRIRAEVSRQGYTLTQIAQEAGIAESSCRMALLGSSRAGAEALSRFLGVPISVLFPGLYLRVRSPKAKVTVKAGDSSRQKRHAASDNARAQA